MTGPVATSIRNDRRLLMVLILMTSFFNAFMGSAINLALPRISEEYAMSAVSLSWVAMAFLLSSAIFLVPFGKFADIFGRKRIFLLGNILFTLSSILCVMAPDGLSFIFFRFVQGMGSAMILSTGIAIIASVFPAKERGKAIGLNISAVYIGLTVAPALGGILTQTFGWRSIFVVNILAGLLVISGIMLKTREEWIEAGHDKFDYRGSLVYMVSLFMLMFGFTKLPKDYAIALAVTGFAGMVLFVAVELRTTFPVLSMQLFRKNRVFTLSNTAALINYAVTHAVTFLLSLYLQYVKGLSPSDAGIILITQPAVMALVASFSGRLSDKYESRILASFGMGIILSGLIMIFFTRQDSSGFYLTCCLAVLGLGFGFFSSPNTNAIMSSVDKSSLGVASAMTSTMRLVGQMTSMAVAAMVIHIFIGEARISAGNADLFMKSMKAVFLLFILISIPGIFASLARGKRPQIPHA